MARDLGWRWRRQSRGAAWRTGPRSVPCSPSVGCLLLVGCLALAAGCASDPETALVGSWQADTSAAATASKAVRIKSMAPDASGSDAMAAARALTNVGLELRGDKSFVLLWQGKRLTGDWSFDTTVSAAQLNISAASFADPTAAAGDANAAAKPVVWLAVLNANHRELELFVGDQTAWKFIKEAASQPGFPGRVRIILKKRGLFG